MTASIVQHLSFFCIYAGINSFIFVMTGVNILLKSLLCVVLYEMHCLQIVFEQIVTGESCTGVVVSTYALVVHLVLTNNSKALRMKKTY